MRWLIVEGEHEERGALDGAKHETRLKFGQQHRVFLEPWRILKLHG